MTSQEVETQAELTTVRLAALLAAWQATDLPTPSFTRAAAVAVFTAKVVASRSADLAVAALAGRPPLGITPDIDNHVERLEQAAQLIIETPELAAERLERLGSSEVLQSEQHTARRAIAEHGFTGWREVVSDDACEVCQPFRDRIHDASEGWQPHHPRCRCSLEPVGEPKPEPVAVEPERPMVSMTYAIR